MILKPFADWCFELVNAVPPAVAVVIYVAVLLAIAVWILTLKAEKPPEKCPSCKEKCIFQNVTCYIPDCGNTGSDERL